VAALLWLTSALLPTPWRFWAWAVAFSVDFTTPLVAERHSPQVPPDKAHLPERYGLFTIILLGECVVRVMHGMESQPGWSVAAATCAVGGLAASFILWWWYFDGVRGAAERHVRTVGDARRLRVWSYAHFPMYLGIAVAGVGLEHAIMVAEHDALHGGEVWLLAAALATIMVSLTTIHAVSDDRLGRPDVARRLAPHYVIAGLTLAAGVVGEHLAPPVFLLVLDGLAIAQVVWAVRTDQGQPIAAALPELS
jgi:low temperature requirement protein LtrA